MLSEWNSKTFLRAVFALLLCFASFQLFAVTVSDRYRSPRNPERKIRRSTELIVLHTTEAPARSSLNKLSDRGEAHFCVTEDGGIYRIVDRDREAFHAGRSMWRGKEDVDKYSIGIECVGYHNKAMPLVQLYAIRDLVKELKTMYGLSDDKVVCHSHVAYGAPNKWQKRRHRGRKRCGMLFAMASVRKVLQLKARPASDVDTMAGRLTVGDEYLRKVLYANTDTMAATYRNGSAPAAAPASGGGLFSGLGRWFGGGTSQAANSSPKPAAVAKPPGKQPAKSPTVQASKPQGVPRSITQLKARGWVLKGTVSKTRTASHIAGGKWNDANTYYTIRNKVIPGNTLNPAKIEKGMGVWLKR